MAPFIDTGRPVAMHGNKRESRMLSGEKTKTLPLPGPLVVYANDNETALIKEERQVSSKSPSSARTVVVMSSRKRTRLDSSHSLKVGNSLQNLIVTIPVLFQPGDVEKTWEQQVSPTLVAGEEGSSNYQQVWSLSSFKVSRQMT